MARKKQTQIDPRDFSKREDDYVLDVVVEDMRRAAAYQRPFFDKFAEYFKLYNSEIDPENRRENGANLFIPYIYNIVETMVPKWLNSMLDARPLITYKPVGVDDVEKARKLTALVAYQMKQNMKAATRLYEIYKSAGIFGTAVSKQVWRYDVKQVGRRRPMETTVTLDDGTEQVTEQLTPVLEEVTIYDAPEMQNIPIETFFFDPAYPDIESSPFCIHEYFKEKHELLKGEKKGVYRNTKDLSDEEHMDGPLADRLSDQNETVGNMKNGVRIWEYWTDDWKVMVANKQTVIQCIPNPYFHKKKPFIKWCPIPMPNEFYGKSPIATLKDLQYELNTLRSQRVDNISLALNRMFIINKNADIDTAQLISRPNGFIEVENISEDIKEIIYQDVTQSAYRDEEIVKGDMDVTSGVHSYDRGQAPARRDTATVASLLTSASSERFKLQALMLAEDPLTELGRQLAELNKQFIEDEVFIRVTDDSRAEDELTTITFEDIDAEFDVVAVGTAMDMSVNKEVRQSQLIQLMQIASGIDEVNKVALVREIFREFDVKDVDALIQELPPEIPGDELGGEQQGAPGVATPMGGVGMLGIPGQLPQV